MAEAIKMPRLSDSMEEGEIVAWHKAVGDAVEKGDLLAEINSDKATMDFESPQKGVLLHIGVAAGGKIEVGALLAIVGKAGEDISALLSGGGSVSAAPAKEVQAVQASVATQTLAKTESVAIAVTVSDESRVKASPLAKSVASQAGIAIETVQGTGDNGRIIKKDVENAIQNGQNKTSTTAVATPTVAPAAASKALSGDDYEDTPVSQMRKVIAQRLSESKFTAPHFYLTVEINMAKTMALRQQVNEIAAPTKISFNDLVVKAVAASLKKHDAINSSWLGDRIRKNHSVNIGVAVAIAEGLLVPVVKNADMKTLSQINTEVKELAGRAKEMRLKPDEMSGSTFTISNLGMFDIEEFTAIINPPNACILAVGSIQQKPIVENGAIVVGNTMKVTLSCDHRVVDGASGAAFLQTLKGILEDPIRLLV